MKKLNINYRMKDVMKKLLIILLLISSVSIWAKEDEKDNPSRRFEEFAKEREYPKGYIPDNARVKAFQQMESIMHEKNSPAMQLALQPEWTNIGPFDIGGRIKSICTISVCFKSIPNLFKVNSMNFSCLFSFL